MVGAARKRRRNSANSARAPGPVSGRSGQQCDEPCVVGAPPPPPAGHCVRSPAPPPAARVVPRQPAGVETAVTVSHRQTAGHHRTVSALSGGKSPFFLCHVRVPLVIHITRSFPAVVELRQATTYGTCRHRTVALLAQMRGQERHGPGSSTIAELLRVLG